MVKTHIYYIYAYMAFYKAKCIHIQQGVLMNRIFSFAAMLCISLLFSCTTTIEPPPFPPDEELGSSSDAGEQSSNSLVEISSSSSSSSKYEQSSSSVALEYRSSSSTQIIPSSSSEPSSSSTQPLIPSSSSSEQLPISSQTQSSSSTQPPIPSSSSFALTKGCKLFNGKGTITVGPDDCVDLDFIVTTTDNNGWFFVCTNTTAINAPNVRSDCNRLMYVDGRVISTRSGGCNDQQRGDMTIGFNLTGSQPAVGEEFYKEGIVVQARGTKYDCLTASSGQTYTEEITGICGYGIVLLKDYKCLTSWQEGSVWTNLCNYHTIINSYECASDAVKTSTCASGYANTSETLYEGNFICQIQPNSKDYFGGASGF